MAGNFASGLSLAGRQRVAEPPDLSDEAFARRDIPLMFTGTYRGAARPLAAMAGKPAKVLARRRRADGADAQTAAAGRTARAVAQRSWAPSSRRELLPAGGAAGARQLFAEAYHRDAVLTALGRAGLPLHVWGTGWEPLAARYPTFVYGGVGSFAETLHTLRRARVVLNINNGFVAGGHERVFTAMCAGAAVFSDANRYYAEAFEEGREIVSFAWPDLASAAGQWRRWSPTPAAPPGSPGRRAVRAQAATPLDRTRQPAGEGCGAGAVANAYSLRYASHFPPLRLENWAELLRGERSVRYRGSSVAPIRNSSTARAHWRPSRIAQTTSDWPRRMSPQAKIFGTAGLVVDRRWP